MIVGREKKKIFVQRTLDEDLDSMKNGDEPIIGASPSDILPNIPIRKDYQLLLAILDSDR